MNMLEDLKNCISELNIDPKPLLNIVQIGLEKILFITKLKV